MRTTCSSPRVALALVAGVVLAGALAAPFPAAAAAPALKVVARVPAPQNNSDEPWPDFLAAQLDGRGATELLVLAPYEVSAYAWRDSAFRRIGRTEAKFGLGATAAGDINGDGFDEMVGLDNDNRVVFVQLANGKLVASYAPRPTDRLIGAVTIADVRQAGEAELVLAVDSRHGSDFEGDPACNRLEGYRFEGGKWTRAWQQALNARGASVTLAAGDYLPAPGNELIVSHEPGDVGANVIEAWRWQGDRLARVAEFSSSAERGNGLQWWNGVSDHLTGSPRTIVGHAIRERRGDSVDRSLLLTWTGREPVVVGEFKGTPLVVGDFRGNGKAGVVAMNDDGKYVLLEP